jgi:hypothetical protein
MGVSVQLHAPAIYPQGKSSWYPLDRRLGGPQSRFGHGGEEKYSQPMPGFEPAIIPPVTQRHTTELYIYIYILGSTAQLRPWPPPQSSSIKSG